MAKRNRKTFAFLITANGFLFFLISFLIGWQLAKAQTINYDGQLALTYFDEPEQYSSQGAAQGISAASLGGNRTAAEGTLFAAAEDSSPLSAKYPEFKDQITSTISPEIPRPGEEVTISLEVYSFDINAAVITWKIDGKQIEKGLGIKLFKFMAKPAGQNMVVTAFIEPTDRPSSLQTFTFKTGDVDLLWQADTYTPPFYKGKALYTPEANLTFIAMARTATGIVDPKATIFKWNINNVADAANSGYGRNTYSFEGPIILRPVDVTVEAYDAKNSGSAASTDITVSNNFTKTLFYENNPLYGLFFNRALRSPITLDKNEFGLSAFPFYQTTINKNSGLIYRWGLDSYFLDIPDNQNTITLRKNQGDSGQSRIDLEIENPSKILQSISSSINIEYDSSSPLIDSASGSEFGQ